MSTIDSNQDDHRSVLANVDSSGKRHWLYVAIVKGPWRFRRQLVAVLLIGFYLAAPWIQIGGLPLLRIDIPERHYIFLGQIFWPQDFFYALLMLLVFLVATVLTVSLVGRIFCGWICPHNVFWSWCIARLKHSLRARSSPKAPGRQRQWRFRLCLS